MKHGYFSFLGILTGLANGVFGSGGGSVAVPLLEKGGLDACKAHATSIAVTLPLSVVSTVLYLKNGNFEMFEAIKYIPGGLVGAFSGGLIIKKIPEKALKRTFGILLIASGIWLLIR